ncbi:MAG: hypothetical protein OEW79_02600 [Betaproteobacteria bacterium]|nr:hypothetical protein [Betaproteobacteria bacterium]MDH4293910.1 hypothetical protein [Betaproteobacteria bacterium]MDH5341705.1 hypothetical protein [Betaproteobacteria bacterium]
MPRNYWFFTRGNDADPGAAGAGGDTRFIFLFAAGYSALPSRDSFSQIQSWIGVECALILSLKKQRIKGSFQKTLIVQRTSLE